MNINTIFSNRDVLTDFFLDLRDGLVNGSDDGEGGDDDSDRVGDTRFVIGDTLPISAAVTETLSGVSIISFAAIMLLILVRSQESYQSTWL